MSKTLNEIQVEWRTQVYRLGEVDESSLLKSVNPDLNYLDLISLAYRYIQQAYEAGMNERQCKFEPVYYEGILRENAFICSECNYFSENKPNFCPGCGARVKEGGDE